MSCINKSSKEYKVLEKRYGDDLAEVIVRHFTRVKNLKEDFYIPSVIEAKVFLKSSANGKFNRAVNYINNNQVTVTGLKDILQGVITSFKSKLYITKGSYGEQFKDNYKIIKDLEDLYPNIIRINSLNKEQGIYSVDITPSPMGKSIKQREEEAKYNRIKELYEAPEDNYNIDEFGDNIQDNENVKLRDIGLEVGAKLEYFKTKFNLPAMYDNTLSNDKGGYVKNGTVYLNPTLDVDKYEEVLIEEYTHIITLKMEKEDPEQFEELFQDLLNTPEYEKIKNKVIAKINNLYPDISNNNLEILLNRQLQEDQKVQYSLKAVEILLSDKAKQVFNKGKKNGWDLSKILTELAIPKEQKQLLLELGITDREQLALELSSKYGYNVEINTAKSPVPNYKGEDIENTTMSFEYNGYKYITDGGMYIKKSLTNEDDFDSVSKKNFNELREKYIEENRLKPTQYYSNLTVPGGTNGSYREQNFETPLIKVPKSHARFNTENTIGFSRNDDRQVYTEKDIDSLLEIMKKSGILEVNCG